MSGGVRRPCRFLLAFLVVFFLAAPAFAAAADSPDVQAPKTTSLVPLYISFATLQALDVRSTMLATHAGAVEANPIMGSVLSSPPAFIASKAIATAGIVFLTDKAKKQHPRAAFVTMVVLNSLYAGVVAHNYSVLSRMR